MTRGVDRVACARGPARRSVCREHLTEKLNKIGRVERKVCGTERCAFCRGHPAIRAERRSIARTRGVPQTALVCGTGSVVWLSGVGVLVDVAEADAQLSRRPRLRPVALERPEFAGVMARPEYEASVPDPARE
jgi:hypothetical protein